MGFFEWAALAVGTGLVMSGVRAVFRRKANVPEPYEGRKAVGLGLLWTGLGTLFIVGALFDISLLKTLFRLFLEAAN